MTAPITSPMSLHPWSARGIALALLTLGSAHVASAAGPDDASGRYTLSPVEGGFLRLDRSTGTVAACTQKSGAWLCEAVEDKSRSLQDQLAKLEDENRALKERVKSLEDSLVGDKPAASPGGPSSSPDGTAPDGTAPGGPGSMTLPTEEEVDKALDYVERIFKKFRDRVQKFDGPAPMPMPSPSKPPQAAPNANGREPGAL